MYMSTQETMALVDRFVDSCSFDPKRGCNKQYIVTIGKFNGSGANPDQAIDDAAAKAGLSHDLVAKAKCEAMLLLADCPEPA